MNRLLLLLAFCCAALRGQTFVQAQTANTAASVTLQQVSITTTAGNLLYVCAQEGANNTSTMTVTDSASQTGWTQTASGYADLNSTHRTGCFYRANSAALTTITATWSGSLSTRVEIMAFEISGMATSSPEDSSVNHLDSSSTTSTSGSLTTTNAADILIDCTHVNGAFTNPAAGSGYTIPTNGSGTRFIMSYKVVAATQSGVTTTHTWTTAALSANVFVGFKAAAAGTRVPALTTLGVGL